MPTPNKTRTAILGARRSVAADRDLARLRAAITAFFFLDGFVFAGWVARIPAIKDQTSASEGALGLALLGVSAGGTATMMATGRLCRRFGNHPTTVAAGVLFAGSVALPPLTHSALALGLVLLVFGTGFGALNVAMNSAAVDLIAALRRPVMPSFHAAFSLGGMAGAGLGGLIADHLSPTRHLSLLAVFGLLLAAAAGRRLISLPVPAPRDGAGPATESGNAAAAEPSPGAERSGRARWLVAVFGLIALCTAYGEGAMADWAALHLHQDLDASAGLAAAGYAVFALMMAVGRLTGTALLERLGQTRALIAGGATAAAGMLLGSLAPTVWLALLGFAVTGLGLANLFPVAIARAGALTGPGGVAAASTLGYGGMLLGPPTIGFLADWYSLPVALTTVAALAAVAAVVAYGTRNAVRLAGN
ncbi:MULTISPECIES: MFS transporter [Streptomyces]|uniref:MFS transporter n=1 Tax=Streptomyces TaxID=1883 RepID=UPI000F7B6207|nr:MFS transporter [Streptomyces sp. WAC05858]RSS35750.1 MFS transporter [Streptomyces sp. WAC05858]WTA79728.1 MFS transporter [Streptomyces antimycoticus]